VRTGWHTNLMRTIPIALTFLLSGCGTNVMYLLKEESRIVAEADPLLVSAEEAGNGMERQVYEAEAAKDEACDFLHSAVFDRFNRDPGFFEQFVSDFSSAVVLFFPVGQVEDCAEAFATYSAAVDNLANSINSAAELPMTDRGGGDIENGVN
jgi:hypothetical protein